ncbi:MAG: hypothetical protein SNF93_08310 [Rikenellaceae bacterium]
MKKNYETPQIEVIEIELEGILCASLGGGDSSSSNSVNILGFGDEDAW